MYIISFQQNLWILDRDWSYNTLAEFAGSKGQRFGVLDSDEQKATSLVAHLFKNLWRGFDFGRVNLRRAVRFLHSRVHADELTVPG